MPLARTAEVVADAREAGVAAIAFNVIGLEHAEAVIAAAQEAGKPVILQVSANAVAFRGAVGPLMAALASAAADAAVPVALHLDHAEQLDLCRAAVAAGCSSVMFDAAAQDDEINARATARAAAWARSEGVWLEAELGEIAGKPGARAGVTDPDAARAYVAATGCDALAVAVGSRHKMADATARLDLDLIARLREAVPVPLVLHGGSGVADDHLAEAVAAGIVKVNVGTRLATAFTAAVADALDAGGRDADPRVLLAAARERMRSTAAPVLARLG